MSTCHSLNNVINGVFSVYKPKGWTSRKATDFVQFALSNELWTHSEPMKRKDRVKIGHGGTLDPMAEGVLGKNSNRSCMKSSFH
jgi:tRNA pseudouridine55 synthase